MSVAGKAVFGKSRHQPPMVPSTLSADLGYDRCVTGP
jgi:hypothetical protein